MRFLRVLIAALLGVLTLAPAAASPAAAAVSVPWAPWITCDAAAGTVTAGLHHANLAAGRKVVATFTVATGLAVTDTKISSLPQYGQTTTVTGTVGANYTIDLIGYARAWDPAPYLSYYETVRVALKYDDGTTIWTGSTATCYYDPRNTYSFTCGGPDAPAFAVSVTGTRATAGGTDSWNWPNRLIYKQFIDERTKGSMFTAHYQADDVSRRITRTGDTWSDPGVAKDLSNHAQFTDHIEINILNSYGTKVGGALLLCDYTAP